MELSPEQIAEALAEGWKPQNGFPRSIYRANGIPYFASVLDVVYFIADRARTSAWHREIYMSLPWTTADDYMSRKQGWRYQFGWISSTNKSRHINDEAAQAFVLKQKELGDLVAEKAALALAKYRLMNGV